MTRRAKVAVQMAAPAPEIMDTRVYRAIPYLHSRLMSRGLLPCLSTPLSTLYELGDESIHRYRLPGLGHREGLHPYLILEIN
jgi:hypothetical protein